MENGKTKYDLNQLSQNARLSYMVAPNLKASLLGRILFTDAGPSSRTPTTPPTVPGIDTYMQGAAVEPSSPMIQGITHFVRAPVCTSTQGSPTPTN